MHRFFRTTVLVSAAGLCLASRCASQNVDAFFTATGEQALSWTQEMVSLGPRPSGSAALLKVQNWIEEKVGRNGLTLQRESFIGQTPIGDIEMVNLSYEIPGSQGGSKVLLLAHYESKRFLDFDFVGANDAASSVALLLSLTPQIQTRAFPFPVEVIFVDGEESFGAWSATDSLYGSRHLATRLEADSVRAAIVVDMIGDRNLRFINNVNTDANLRQLLASVLSQMGRSELLETRSMAVEDDHTPLAAAGIPTLHLMDFTFGGDTPPGSYWHTPEDTVDKLSAESLSITAEVLLRILDQLTGSS